MGNGIFRKNLEDKNALVHLFNRKLFLKKMLIAMPTKTLRIHAKI